MNKPTRKSRPRKGSRSSLTVTIPGLVRSGQDADFREMISVMYGALGRLQTMRRTLAESLGLGSAEFAVVMTLLRLENTTGVRIRRIADDLYVAAANITATVGRLEQTQWVIKTSDPNDSRALAVRLTPQARERLQGFTEQLHFVNDVWFEGTGASDLKSVISFFHRLIDRYEPALAAARSITRASTTKSR
jgi:DNA-binding MarR family transcriptional regulator